MLASMKSISRTLWPNVSVAATSYMSNVRLSTNDINSVSYEDAIQQARELVSHLGGGEVKLNKVESSKIATISIMNPNRKNAVSGKGKLTTEFTNRSRDILNSFFLHINYT